MGNGWGSPIALLVSSTDLSHWRVVGSRDPRLSSPVFFCPPQFQKLEFVHGLWVGIVSVNCQGIADETSIWTSPDGVKWTQRYEGRYRQEIRDITFADGRLVAVDHIGSMLESDRWSHWN
jgi:hypothetical protein